MRKPHLLALFASAVTLVARAPASAQELPDPRAHHQLVYHEGEQRVLLVGGSTPRDGGHHFFEDIWSWNGTAWQRAGSLPFPRSSHRVAWDSARNAIVLFGGGSGRTFAADSLFRAWDGVKWRPVGRSPYGGLAEPGMCHDRQRSRLVLFGGWDGSNELHGETWEWTGDTLLIIDGAGPSARGGHMFAYDPRRQRCLLFGGRGADDVLGDTWEWDGTAWRQIHTSGPSPRMVGAAATDLANDRIILFSGWTADQTLLDDTWAWDGETWELISRAGPAARISGQLAFDGAGVVLFGGRTRTADGFRDLNDTWRLRGTSWVPTQVPAGADSSAGRAQVPVQDSTDIVFSITGLRGPEAVRYDSAQDVYFISNFGEAADDERDANGFIARVSAADGRVEALRFMTGTAAAPLHMPRGMYIRNDTLWVADVDGVHGFLSRTGAHAAFIDMTVHEPGFLNDLAAGPDGGLYVTDTGRARVYRIGADGQAEVAIEHEHTGPPNGITWDASRAAFLLAPWGGETMLRAWDPASGELRDILRLEGGRFDGIEVVDGRVLIASQDDSTIHVIAEERSRPLIRVTGRPADIGIDTRRGRVAVPYIALNRVDVWAIRRD